MGDLSGYGNVEPENSEFTPLDPGEYDVSVCDAQITPSKSGNGEVLKLVYEVSAGKYASKRTIFDFLNVTHSNPVAQRIGRENLTRVKKAIGRLSAQDTAELIGGKMRVKLAIEENNGNLYNRVKKYEPLARRGSDESQEQPKQDAANNDDTPPWEA